MTQPETFAESGQGQAVDTHAHVYPAWYLDRLESIGVPAASTAIARGMGADATGEDLAKRLHWMDVAGVSKQVLAVTPQVPSGPEETSSAQAARAINDEYERIIAAHDGRFLFYAALPLPHVQASLDEMARALDELGAAGVSFAALLPGGLSLADPVLAPVWEALDERAAIVNIHATGGGAASPMITDHDLVWVNGAPVEDATAVLQLMKAGVPNRYSRIRFHIAHLAGDLPFLAQRIEDNYTDWGAFPSSPLEMLRGMWFDAANFHEPSLRLAAETLGHGRILAGSDHPYFQEDKYVRAFDYIRTSRLQRAQIEQVLHRNAAALYRL